MIFLCIFKIQDMNFRWLDKFGLYALIKIKRISFLASTYNYQMEGRTNHASPKYIRVFTPK